MSSTNVYNAPNCIILPSSTGSTTNCLTIPFPSMSQLLLVLIISWIIYMGVAYIIYYFLNTKKECKCNYWMILLILVISGIIVSLINALLWKFP